MQALIDILYYPVPCISVAIGKKRGEEEISMILKTAEEII